jgi:hypothetical protein
LTRGRDLAFSQSGKEPSTGSRQNVFSCTVTPMHALALSCSGTKSRDLRVGQLSRAVPLLSPPFHVDTVLIRMAQRELGTVIQWNLHVEGIGTIKTDRGDNLLFERQSLNGFLKSAKGERVEFTRTDEDFAVDVTPTQSA